MSATPNTLRVHHLLAASHPEPIDRKDLVRRLGLPDRVVERALAHGVQTQALRQVRCLSSRQGYAYTVNA